MSFDIRGVFVVLTRQENPDNSFLSEINTVLQDYTVYGFTRVAGGYWAHFVQVDGHVSAAFDLNEVLKALNKAEHVRAAIFVDTSSEFGRYQFYRAIDPNDDTFDAETNPPSTDEFIARRCFLDEIHKNVNNAHTFEK